MQAMVEREAATVLCGTVQVDDAYLGCDLVGGTAAPGSDNKLTFIGEVSLNDQGHPLRAKLTPLPGFTRAAIARVDGREPCAHQHRDLRGLACFAGVTDIGWTQQPTVVGKRKPEELPMFRWVNTVLDNLKTGFSGDYHSFDFSEYAERYLDATAYRLNCCFDLQALPPRLRVSAVACAPRPVPWIRRVADVPC